MENSKTRLSILIDRYLAGKCSPEESNELEMLYIKAAIKTPNPPISDAEAVEINRIGEESWEQLMHKIKKTKPKKGLKLWPAIISVAASVVVIFLGVWFYLDQPIFSNKIVIQNDISPGSNKAILTLSNGEVINLSGAKSGVVIHSNKLSYIDGTEIVSEATRELTVSTPRGGTYQITLPDGTNVWLNADSKISFPSQFIGDERRVSLEGEAYFEVAKSYVSVKGHQIIKSFVVASRGQSTKVLGTHFNINSYADEAVVRTTLLEGVVQVLKLRSSSEGKDDAEGIILKPNQQAILATNKLTVKEVDVNEAVAWRDGLFRFYRADIRTVMRQIARWYDVEVIYETDLPERKLTGEISRTVKASQALELLKNANVYFRIEGKKIIVTTK